MSNLPPPPSGPLGETPPAPPAPRHGALVPVIAGVGAVALVVVIIIGGAVTVRNRQAASRYCDVYDSTHAELVASVKQGSGRGASYSDLQESVNRTAAVLRQRRDAAPGSLRGSWDLLIDDQATEPSLSQKRARDEAVRAINDYARDVCGLDGDM